MLQQLSDGGFEFFLRHPPRMIEANNTLSIQQDVHGHRCHTVLFVIRLAHGDWFVAQETVVYVTHLEDVTQLFVRRRWPAGFHVPVSLCRGDDCETAGAVPIEEVRNTGALGFALRAPVRPEKRRTTFPFSSPTLGTRGPRRRPVSMRAAGRPSRLTRSTMAWICP